MPTVWTVISTYPTVLQGLTYKDMLLDFKANDYLADFLKRNVVLALWSA